MSSTSEESLQVAFVSSWQEGEIRTMARLNLQTGEVRDIQVSEVGEDYEHLIEEYIESWDGTRRSPVIRNESDGEYRLACKTTLLAFANRDRNR